MGRLSLTLGLFYLFILSCSPVSDRENLEKDIETNFAQGGGTFALAWKNLDSGEEFLINADTVFHAASTMKTPVMIEVFKQADEGIFKMSDSLLVKNEFYSIIDSSEYTLSSEEDSELELYNMIGQKLPISELVYRMIIKSSNLATNIIIDLVDARKVTATMRQLGAKQIEVLRGVEDTKAYLAGRNNTTTALDLMVIFENLATGNLINEDANRSMIDILLDQQFKDIIPAYLPANVKVAHKTGSITAVHHDSGLVILPDGAKYVLILLSKNLENFEHGTSTMAKVSELIYKYMLSSSED